MIAIEMYAGQNKHELSLLESLEKTYELFTYRYHFLED